MIVGKCSMPSACEEEYCCACCPEQDSCFVQCDYMDDFYFVSECDFYTEVKTNE